MSRREHAWIGGGLLLMAVTTLFWMQGFLGDRTLPSVVLSERGWTWESGQTNHYRLAFESRLSLGDSVILQSIKGQLSVEVESVSADEVQLRSQMLDLELGGVLTDEPGLLQALGASFRLVLGKQGIYRRILSDATSPRAKGLLEALLEPLTCELSPGMTHWQREEIHLGHGVEAHYRDMGVSGVEKILKRTGMNTRSAGIDSRLRSLEHKARYRPSETAAWLAFAHVSESATLELPGGAKAISRMDLILRALPPGLARSSPPTSVPTLAATVPASKGPVGGKVLLPQPLTRAGDVDRARLLELLDKLLSTEELDPAILQQLEALLRKFPELALLIPKRVKPGISDQGSAQLLHLLELIGHPNCQIALCEIASSPKQDRREQLRALVALGGLQAPTRGSIARLQGLSDWTVGSRENAATALLALGALGPRMTSSKDYEALKQHLAQRLLLSADEDEGLCLLDALANTRDASLTEAVANNLSSISARLRRQAAMALAKIPGRSSEDHLLGILETSQEKNLRVAAAQSLANRSQIDASTRDLALLRLQVEPDAEVRYGLARLLARELITHPELHPSLTAALAREQDDRVRAVILRGLIRSADGLPSK